MPLPGKIGQKYQNQDEPGFETPYQNPKEEILENRKGKRQVKTYGHLGEEGSIKLFMHNPG